MFYHPAVLVDVNLLVFPVVIMLGVYGTFMRMAKFRVYRLPIINLLNILLCRIRGDRITYYTHPENDPENDPICHFLLILGVDIHISSETHPENPEYIDEHYL
jgi:hypothetical protein